MAEDGLIPDEGAPLKVAHVQRQRKGGKVHLYFRKGDYREGPLAGADGTQALKDEVAAILKRLETARTAASSPIGGTLGAMLGTYNRSAGFLSNARSTQAGYQDYIDELTEDLGDVALSDITRSWVIELRDAWAARGHRAANQRMQVLKNALAPAIDDETDTRIKGDPFHKVRSVRRPHDAGETHPVWDDAEVTAAIEEAITRRQPGLARGIALGRWGGFRRGTICAIPLNARSTGHDEDGVPHARIVWITEKRRVLADKREDPRLTALLKRTANQALTIAYNARGGVWKPRQFNQALDRLLDRLAAAGTVRAALDDHGKVYCPLTVHGLRHSRGVELALAGASDAEIMSQLEHATDRAAKIYRRQADRRRMADAAQDRVDRVVGIRALRQARDTANGR